MHYKGFQKQPTVKEVKDILRSGEQERASQIYTRPWLVPPAQYVALRSRAKQVSFSGKTIFSAIWSFKWLRKMARHKDFDLLSENYTHSKWTCQLEPQA